MNELEQFKKDILEGYIYRYMDKLLDFSNKIKKAKSLDEISIILETEQKELAGLFNDKEDSKDIQR